MGVIFVIKFYLWLIKMYILTYLSQVLNLHCHLDIHYNNDSKSKKHITFEPTLFSVMFCRFFYHHHLSAFIQFILLILIIRLKAYSTTPKHKKQ